MLDTLTKGGEMNWQVFALVLAAEYAAIVLQGIAAWLDGYLTQAQMQSHGIMNGWSFMEHCGIWMDVIIISPAVAYFVSNHQFAYTSKWGMVAFVATLASWLVLIYLYQQGGKITPEAHTHYGTTTVAGWIYFVYAVLTTWVLVMAFISGLATPAVSKLELSILAIALMPFFYYGVVKFSDRWTWSPLARYQVIVEILFVWTVTLFRVW